MGKGVVSLQLAGLSVGLLRRLGSIVREGERGDKMMVFVSISKQNEIVLICTWKKLFGNQEYIYAISLNLNYIGESESETTSQ